MRRSIGLGILCALLVQAPAFADTAIFGDSCASALFGEYKALPGVEKVEVGKTGGAVVKIFGGGSRAIGDQVDGLRITYNPAIVRYEVLLRIFLRSVEPQAPRCMMNGRYIRPVLYFNQPAQFQMIDFNKRALAKKYKDQHFTYDVRSGEDFFPAPEPPAVQK